MIPPLLHAKASATLSTQYAAQVDVDYSDADKRTVLRFFAALAELTTRQPARSASGVDGVPAKHQVTHQSAAGTYMANTTALF